MVIKARFDGQVFVPEGPVDLPVGYVLEIPLGPPVVAKGSGVSLVELMNELDEFPVNPHWPADGAAQHDHHLYGTPKRP